MVFIISSGSFQDMYNVQGDSLSECQTPKKLQRKTRYEHMNNLVLQFFWKILTISGSNVNNSNNTIHLHLITQLIQETKQNVNLHKKIIVG